VEGLALVANRDGREGGSDPSSLTVCGGAQ